MKIKENETVKDFLRRMSDEQLKAEFILAKRKFEDTMADEPLAALVDICDECVKRRIVVKYQRHN